MSVTVEMGFGFGPTDTVTSWADISDWVIGDGPGEVVQCVSGRDADTITPGSGSVVLDNSDGRWDPRNSSGPYFGQLDVGVPMRISDEGEVLWSGFVSSGWPQQLTARLSTVTVVAQDAIGLIAQGDAPVSAWDATVGALASPPDHWWRTGPDGWVDRMTGAMARHTSVLTPLDPVVDGGGESWGQDDPDGIMVGDPGLVPAFAGDLGSTWSIVSCWIRWPSDRVLDSGGDPEPVTLLRATRPGGDVGFVVQTAGLWDVLLIDLRTTVARTVWRTTESVGSGSRESISWFDDRPHHVMFAAAVTDSGGFAGRVRMWVDGIERELWESATTAPLTPSGSGYFSVGGVDGAVPYQGVIDHLLMWDAVDVDVESLAKDLFGSGRLAWAGQRLDERLRSIVLASSVATHIGSLDTSGIVTLQGYRQGDVSGLLQTIEDTEQGRVWCDASGDLRFSSRRWPWTDTRSSSVQATFSDRPSDLASGAIEMLDSGTVIDDDPLDLVNVAQVTSAFGRMQTAEDPVSIAKYGRRQPIHLSGLLHSSDRQSLDLAEFLLLTKSTPRVKVRQVAFAVESDRTVTLPFAVEVTEGDLVRVILDAGLDVLAHVRRIQRSWSAAGQVVTLTLDSTLADLEWFEWGTSTWGGTDGWAI